MTWVEITEILGNLGEFLGSVAVLVTLIYVATQVRMIRSQSEKDHLSRTSRFFIDHAMTTVNDKELSDLVVRAEKAVNHDWSPASSDFTTRLQDGGLEDSEIIRILNFINALYLNHLDLARTAPDRKSAEVIERNWARNVTDDPLRSLWWEAHLDIFLKHEAHRDFVTRVTDLIERDKRIEHEN